MGKNLNKDELKEAWKWTMDNNLVIEPVVGMVFFLRSNGQPVDMASLCNINPVANWASEMEYLYGMEL